MKIAVVGSYGVGLTMRVPRMPGAGETLLGGEFSDGPGGKGSNQAIGAARLGADVSLLTAIGADAFGRSGQELWATERVDARKAIVVDGAATMVGFIVVEPNGENRIVIAAGALDHLDEVAVETFRSEIAAADVVVVSMEIPLVAVLAALRIGREEGTLTLLNPAPAQPLLDDAWNLIDIVTPNQTEAPILLGVTGTDEDLAQALRDRTSGSVVLTRGSAGAIVVDDSGTQIVAARAVEKVIDTTGAGDAFTAALAVALAEGRPLTAAVEFAASAGAHAVTISGVIPSLPTRDQLETDDLFITSASLGAADAFGASNDL